MNYIRDRDHHVLARILSNWDVVDERGFQLGETWGDGDGRTEGRSSQATK